MSHLPGIGLRLARRSSRFAFGVLHVRWDAWARTIADRYARRPTWQAPLALALVQRWRPVSFLQPVSHYSSFTIAPRVALTVVPPAWVVAGPAGTMPVPPLPRILRQSPDERLVRRLQSREQIEMIRTERLARRLVARGERIEAAAPGTWPVARPVATAGPRSVERPADVPELTSMPPPLLPVLRVVHRPPGVPGQSEPGRLSNMATPGAHSAETTTRPGWPAVPGRDGPAVDLNHLTDQVIQAIDRRIIAHRERLGRI